MSHSTSRYLAQLLVRITYRLILGCKPFLERERILEAAQRWLGQARAEEEVGYQQLALFNNRLFRFGLMFFALPLPLSLRVGGGASP